MRAPESSGVALTPNHRRELDFTCAGVVEGAKSEHEDDFGAPGSWSAGRDRSAFADQLLGGLTQGAPGSDPSTRKPRTDAELGRFYIEEI